MPVLLFVHLNDFEYLGDPAADDRHPLQPAQQIKKQRHHQRGPYCAAQASYHTAQEVVEEKAAWPLNHLEIAWPTHPLDYLG